VKEEPADEEGLGREWEERVWECGRISDACLLRYLQSARSIAAFAGMCSRGSPDDMYEAAQSDETTMYALDVLHRMQYDSSKALQLLAKQPAPPGYDDKKWSEDEQKKFVKGLRQYGKNFFRIRKELLANRDTSELIEFYYLWKKTPQAINSRSRRRITRPSSSAAKKSTAASNAAARSTTPVTSGPAAPPSLPSTPSNSQANKKSANNNGILSFRFLEV
jgi:arginine-glutamic acid dipeptide repeat-containing protein